MEGEMAEGKLGSKVRLNDGRVGEVFGVKYVGSPQGKRPLFYVRFPNVEGLEFRREEEFVWLPDEDAN
jgi:hypothetical protein